MGGDLIQPSLELAQERLDRFGDYYNWVRPHEAIGQRPPGSIYHRSARLRPDRVSEVEYDSGVTVRKVCAAGFFAFKGEHYRAGKGLIGERVGIFRREQDGEFAVLFGSYCLGLLRELAT